MLNPNSIIADLRMMPDAALQRMAMLHKQDPYLLPLIISEDTARKRLRSAAAAEMQRGPQPKVVDQALMAMGQQPQPAPAQAAGLPGLQAPNMQNMADGGIAGYDDAEGYAEGGVARYAEGRKVSADTQLERDKDALQILIEELRSAQARASSGDVRAQGDVEALQREIKRLTKGRDTLQKMLTDVMPVGTAQAAPAAPKAAKAEAPTGGATEALSGKSLEAARAGQIPGSEITVGGKRYTWEGQPVAAPREFTMGERALGAGETALSLLSGIPGVVLGSGRTALEAVAGGRAPTEADFARNVGSFTYAPRTEAGREMTEDVGYALGRLPPYIPGAQAGRLARSARPAVAAAEAEAAAAKVAAPRLGQTVVGATRAEKEMAAARAAQALRADQEAAATTAQRAARTAVDAERMPGRAAYGQIVPQRAGIASQAGIASLAAEPPQGGAPAQEEAPYSNEGRNYPAPITTEDKKDLISTAKQTATPEIKSLAKKEGWTNDDWLTLGFSLLANKSPYFTEALGIAGLNVMQGRKEREKTAREAAKEESEMLYRERLGKKAEQEAKYIEESRGPAQAMQIANTAYKNWEAGLSALERLNLTEDQRRAEYDRILKKTFESLGLPVPTGVSSAAPALPAVPQGVKVRQIGG